MDWKEINGLLLYRFVVFPVDMYVCFSECKKTQVLDCSGENNLYMYFYVTLGIMISLVTCLNLRPDGNFNSSCDF